MPSTAETPHPQGVVASAMALAQATSDDHDTISPSFDTHAPALKTLSGKSSNNDTPSRPNGLSSSDLPPVSKVSLPDTAPRSNGHAASPDDNDEAADVATDLPRNRAGPADAAPGDVQGPPASQPSPQNESSDATEQRPRHHQRQSSRTRILSKIRSMTPSTTSPANVKTRQAADEADVASPPVDAGSDADEEDSVNESLGMGRRVGRDAKGKGRRRFLPKRSDSSPASPSPRRPAFRSVSFAGQLDEAETDVETRERNWAIRRASLNDLSANERQGVSEDEGRARASRRAAWRRKGSAWFSHSSGQHLDKSSSAQGGADKADKPSRPRNLKRLSNLGGGSYDGSSSPWHLRSDPAQRKWRQLKAGLKLLGQKRKAENRVDLVKSAELVAELLAGSPAAVIMASSFQRDEHERRRVPILLEQLRVTVTDSQRREDSSNDYHISFRIECEYFSGRMHMKWTVWRSLFEFLQMHTRLKFQSSAGNMKSKDTSIRTRMPRFPKSAFPFLKNVRGIAEDEEEEAPAEQAEDAMPRTDGVPAEASRADGIQESAPSSPSASRVLNLRFHRRESSQGLAERKDNYAERQRKTLESYLREMIRFQMFRVGSNRICMFLELSTVSVRMAIDGSYKGKEGTLWLRNATGMDSRRKRFPQRMLQSDRAMWFLVRQSYIFCVDAVDEDSIYDVFLVDADMDVQAKRPRLRDQKGARDLAKAAQASAAHPRHHILRLSNSERKVTLAARNERQLTQFEESIKNMLQNTEWAKKKRFDSFAPVRQNVYAMWLVDGRDYFWNVSRGIAMAKHVIYIHDWWLSPELYMRRPAAVSAKWRLDRMLLQKASEGVKIYIVVYRNVNTAIPIQSDHTKSHLLDLHPNIFVQRSPNQIRQKSFFWAHHEKLCVIDYNLAFCGGVDLCFGRYDTPEHRVTDDKKTGLEPGEFPRDSEHCQTWPGKDYSNPRVQDFYELEQPYAEMYDRSKVPRMPWHDIAMQVMGQPARDLARHFVQRWNYVLRQRTPSRPTPFLVPPPDFTEEQLERYGLQGTCEVQMLRSATEWSIGTIGKTEHSILNAYVRLIDRSDHFVYIENQFYVSSTMMDNNTRISNPIGDALYQRIVRAHRNQEAWRCVLIIPLMPGFQSTVDSQDGTSVRLIMTSQYRSICRGKYSLFERLRDAGIEPLRYVEFYSLRNWGKIGPQKALVTEQLYIHAKCMVVDDRYAIIGSANINERSMLGSRDSEIAAVVRDTDFIDSYMAGKPYKVARFAHTLRMRLMREHMGVDVDHEAIKQFAFERFSYDDDDEKDDDEARARPEPPRVGGAYGARVHHNVMRDPLDDDFLELWSSMARRNTDIYRQVFRCMPDDTVRTWKEYQEFTRYGEKFAQAQGLSTSGAAAAAPARGPTGPPGAGMERSLHSLNPSEDPSSRLEELGVAGETQPEPEVMDGHAAEGLLKQVTGHLVDWPYKWLEEEERGGKWLYALDQMSPIEIYD